MMLRMHNLHGTKAPASEDSYEEEEEDEEDEEERKPQLELAMVSHYGGINRVRVKTIQGACSTLSGACCHPLPAMPVLALPHVLRLLGKPWACHFMYCLIGVFAIFNCHLVVGTVEMFFIFHLFCKTVTVAKLT